MEHEAVDTFEVGRVADFEVSGAGEAPEWAQGEWLDLRHWKGGDVGYTTRLKALYSTSGIYFLFECEDRRLTATLAEDFLDLWNEDVVEVFLWPDESLPVYFEYELSPLNHELPILVPNHRGTFLGWRPWHYEGSRRTRHATSVRGGARESGAAITAWTAEFFIPYELLKPLGNVPPRPGTVWRANFYRCDYDRGGMAAWSWQRTEVNFHEFKKFGRLAFR